MITRYSYKEIVDAFRLSINTVKNFFRCNNLIEIYKKDISVNCASKIKECKKFYSSKYRKTWFNNNLDKVDRKVYYSLRISFKLFRFIIE